jgi:hypothetical protein
MPERGVDRERARWSPHAYITDEQLTTDAATLGIVPRKHIPDAVRVFDTINARSESIGDKRSFP